jgi:tripartite ATP-independent transporter DctM subunit
MLAVLFAWSLWAGRHLPLSRFERREALAALRHAGWEIPLPLVVLGGIYGGWFAISEAAAVTAVYALILVVLIRREVPLRALPAVMREASVVVGGILAILGVSLASTNYLIDAGVPDRVFEAIRTSVDSRTEFLIALNLFLLALGTMLEIFSALVLMVPLLLPVAAGYDIHPVHLGIIFLANMQIGYFTPPVGMNLFIASYRFGRPVLALCRATLPWFFLLLLALILITYWPALSLWLPARLAP